MSPVMVICCFLRLEEEKKPLAAEIFTTLAGFIHQLAHTLTPTCRCTSKLAPLCCCRYYFTMENDTCPHSIRAESLNKTILFGRPKFRFGSVFRAPDMRQPPSTQSPAWSRIYLRVSKWESAPCVCVWVQLSLFPNLWIRGSAWSTGARLCWSSSPSLTSASSALSTVLVRHQLEAKVLHGKLSAHCGALRVLWLFHIATEIELISEMDPQGFGANNTVRKSRRGRWFGVAQQLFLPISRSQEINVSVPLKQDEQNVLIQLRKRPAVFYLSIRQESFPGAGMF